MDDKLLQILDNSACLSKGQLTGYIKHTLYPEELRAVELHLSSCALCSDALDGMEMQQDVDALIASMIPPVLPALAPKEKPKEKKEIPVAVRTEKAEAAPAPKPAPALKQDVGHKTDHNTVAFRPRQNWARPIGIAAALVLAFGAFWYFEFNRDNSKKQIAQQREITPDTITDKALASQPAAQAVMPGPDSLAKLAAKKHADSIFIAKRDEQRLKAKKDSLLAINLIKDSGKSVASESPAVAASRMAVADQAEETEAKKPAAAPAKPKEDAKKEPTDYELGMRKYKEKNYASALLYFKSAESDKEDPKHWEAVYYSGICNRNLNKERRARKLFERVVEAGAPQKKSAQKQLDDMKKGDK
jgi:TolA-binding protein